LHALELLSGSPHSAAAVGRELGVNRSTALRLLGELEKAGYVIRDARTKRYATSASRLLGLVSGPSARRDWGRDMGPVLAKIRDETSDSAILAVPAERSMTYLSYYPTRLVLGVTESAGASRPMHCSALGKAYLSALPSDELDAILVSLDYVGGTHRAVVDSAAMLRAVTEAAAEGYATDLEETYDDVRCVAVPLRIDGRLVGAVGVTGPASRLPMSRIRELGSFLRRACADL
jgi:DNA-binding IclR family transcriptional regulator